MGFISKLLSFGSDKDLKRYQKIVARINDMEPAYQKMADDELRGQTARFRERYGAGETLDDLLPEAFAVVREASVRTTGLRHFDVQLIGGMALHEGHIAEMKTGEGKTLVSTLAGYLNAIPGTGVHIVTVNDYLAKRDSEWMGQIYRFLGLEVGLLQNGMGVDRKRRAYQADVTYGTNSEFGFDYLRDNMVIRPERRMQRGHAYAIVDEVDSILIDEARTPLIISGQGDKSTSTYRDFARAVRGLERGYEPEVDMLSMDTPPEPTGDFVMDEAKHTIVATERGLKKIEQRLNIDDIYADLSGQLANHLQQALKAQYMFHRDKQYVVTGGEVKIVDEFTGRIMEGRRYSEGLHQAIEAKEGVLVREENQTLATITLQNYFRLYEKLAGMTGTALTEDAEFRETYNLPVQVIPPNKPVIRQDHDDLVYRTIDAKFNAVAEDVAARHASGQPVLVGTVSIESSERLSRTLSKHGIKHEVLNAKLHEREAHIVAQAGRKGAVTIATNMAGRGTDILLGGNPEEMANDTLRARGFDPDLEDGAAVEEGQPPAPTAADREAALAEARAVCAKEREEVVAAGGLTVIGTERHESRRIDNQLRGRSGRQGDPGETQFYLSLEDDLMRMFGGDAMDRVANMMVNWDMPDDMPIQHKMITKAVEGAQRKVEDINFSMRKNVLEYDDVMDKQRKVIYAERNKILDGKDLGGHIDEVIRDTVRRCVQEFCAVDAHEGERDLEGLRKWVVELTGRTDAPVFEDVPYEELCGLVLEYVQRCYDEKTAQVAGSVSREYYERAVLRADRMRKAALGQPDAPGKPLQARMKGMDDDALIAYVGGVVADCVPALCSADAGDGARARTAAWAAELAGRPDAPELDGGSPDELAAQVHDYVLQSLAEEAARRGDETVRELNTRVMLRVIDTRWMSYLQEMDYLKTGIGLRGYGQRDPLVEYKTEAYRAFQQLVDTMYEDYLRTVLRVVLKKAPAPTADDSPALKGASFSGPEQVDGDRGMSPARRQAVSKAVDATAGRAPQGVAGNQGAGKVQTYRKSEDDNPYVNVGRNDPCPCGSGKKFKKCHGRNL